MTATTATTLTAGDVITARPWEKGRQLDAQQAVVTTVSAPAIMGPEYVMAWFPQLGYITDAEVGHALQPVLWAHAERTGHVASWSRARRTVLGKACNAYGGTEVAPLYQVICRLASGLERVRRASRG
jgi:hypothetical protein